MVVFEQPAVSDGVVKTAVAEDANADIALVAAEQHNLPQLVLQGER